MKDPDQTPHDLETQPEKIGQLLLKHTQLTEEQLNEALELQESSGMLLGQILLQDGYIQPHDIIKVICYQIDIPYIQVINVEEVDPEITQNIPINYAKHQEILPILETDLTITIVMSDPFNFDTINDIREIFKKEVEIVVSSPAQVQNGINQVYERATKTMVDTLEEEFDEALDLEGPIDILDANADEAPVIRFVNSVIFRAVKEKTSDIHIEPYEKETIYRFRINGIMTEVLRQPIKTHSAVSSRIKVMTKSMDIAEKRLPQDGRIKIKMAGKDFDIRLSTVPVQNGERIVMRILEKGNTIMGLEALGFEGIVLENLNKLIQRKHGVLYVSGPTGSGKTTTLMAVLDRINSPDKMIITVEDPVEYEVPGISQIQVNSKINLSFAVALRAIVRQDPDIIMVGETRDLETATMAIEASLTGHFVLSTIHTNDAASAPNRLIDMGVQPFLIASSLIGILAQRLIQTLCEECKRPHEVKESDKDLLGVDAIPSDATIFEAVGCQKCNFKGYTGRTTVSELLLISDEIKALVLQKADAGQIKKMAISQGMETLRISAVSKVFKGSTSIEEVVRAINVEEEFIEE
ncbi:MAG: type II secretion system protein GspE [Epsilonproteobacteria bacterium]|nr:MAG: type II secretion system protein GspE [Campylobacterota bacterium]RLA67362.1 MAG: type II secretion system protein GspE [Campylobacterota bacterium]